MTDPRLKKLLYRADHRGFREADIVIGGFARARLFELSPAQVDEFELLLDQPDQDLYAWIIEREPTPESFDGEILVMLRAFLNQAHTTIGAQTGA